MITVPPWLKNLAQYFSDNHHQFYLVGGAVRDQLLAQPVKEWDAATDAHPDMIEKLLRDFGAKQIGTIGKRFGTITATFEAEIVEITTFRSESYEITSRQPTVTFGQTIQEDLSRRDFTVNAIAYEILSGKVLDPYNGAGDMAQKIIRTVGHPEERFSEDPLRMLRAIRFMVTLGFIIEYPTLHAIKSEGERFAILSAERVAQEMDKILLVEEPSFAIRALTETGLINYILPELLPSIDLEFEPGTHKDIYGHILQVLDQTPPKLELRWCALLHDIAKPETRKKIGGEYHFLGHEVIGAKIAKTVLRRLKYSNEFVDYVSKLVYLHQRIPNDDGLWTDGAVRRFVRDAGDCLEDLFTFAGADSTGGNQNKLARYASQRQTLQNRIAKLNAEAEIAKIRPPLDGQELMTMFNRPAGPWIKPIKEKLLGMVLDGELKQEDKAKATEIAKGLIEHK